MASNSTDRRVVITGLGVVTPLGNQLDVFWNNLIAGQCGVDRITSFDTTAFDTKIAAEVKDFDPTPAFPSPKEIRRADRYSQFGIYAGWSALKDSGLDLDKENRDEIGVISAPASAACKPRPSNTKFCWIAGRDGFRRS